MGPIEAQSKTSAVQPTEFLFQEGEKVLCFHNYGDHLYEGIIYKAEARNQGKTKRYFVCISGGKNGSSWNQWLLENFVLKYDDAGLARKEELSKAHGAKFNKKVKETTPACTEEGSSCSKTDLPFINTEEIVEINTKNEHNRDPSEDGSYKVKSPIDLAAPSPFNLITQVKYHNLLVKIFSGSTGKNMQKFYFEPLVFLDPKSIVSKSRSHGSLKQDFIRITIQMWNLDIRSKVLDRLRSLECLQNASFGEEDICVMPFETVQLVCKSGSLPQFISLTDKRTPYLRSNEDLYFYLLVDESSSANVLAHDIRQNPEFYLINDWQLKLECSGFATESETTPAGSTSTHRLTRSYTISICSPEVSSKFAAASSAGSSSVAKSMDKLPRGGMGNTNDPASSSWPSTTGSVTKEIIGQSNLADIVQQAPHSSETTFASPSQFIVTNIKYLKTPEGVFLSWQPPQSTDGEIIEYSVSLAVKRSSATQSEGSASSAEPSKLPLAEVYRGLSPWCTIPNSSLLSAHIDMTIKPAITFLISTRNEKGYGPPNKVMLLLDSYSRINSAVGAVEFSSMTSFASDLSAINSNRPASSSRSPIEVFTAEPFVPPLYVVDSPPPVLVQEDIAQSNLPEVDHQQSPSSSQTSNLAATLEMNPLVTMPFLNDYPIMIKDEPVDGMETSLGALAEAQVFTVQVVDLEEEEDQPPLSIATTASSVTSQANTTSSPSIYTESAGILAVHFDGFQIAQTNPAPKPSRGRIWQPWSTSETSTTTTTSLNEKAETDPIITANKSELVAVPSASVATTRPFQSVLDEHIKDQIIVPVKRSNPFPEQTKTAPKRLSQGVPTSLTAGGSSDGKVFLSTATSGRESLESGESAPLPVFEEGELSAQDQDLQNFAKILVNSYSGHKTRSSFKNFTTEMNDYILSFAAGSKGEPHLLPGEIAIKIINSMTQRVESVDSVEFWKVKPLIVDVSVCILHHLYLNHVELAGKEEEDRDRISAYQTDAYDLITFCMTACEAQFADCIDDRPELLLFAADCCILNCCNLNDDGATVSLESHLIDKKVEWVNNSSFFLKKFYKATERVKISKMLADNEERILGLVKSFSPGYDKNNLIGS